jgi:hypothetical protein
MQGRGKELIEHHWGPSGDKKTIRTKIDLQQDGGQKAHPVDQILPARAMKKSCARVQVVGVVRKIKSVPAKGEDHTHRLCRRKTGPGAALEARPAGTLGCVM